MRRLGKVLHATKRGLVVRAGQTPKPGVPVYSGKRKRVGQVWDVFGPVDNPYVCIKPAPGVAEDLLALTNKELFIRVVKHEKEKKTGRMPRVRKPETRT